MSATVAEGVVRIRTDTSGTSPSALKREGEKAGHAYAGGVSHSVKGIVGTIGGFFAVEKIGEFAKKTVEAASDDQAAQRKLAIAIKNSTDARGEDIKSTEEWLTKNSLATGISKDDLMPVYQQLVSSTGSLTKAKKELNTAEDVSAGTGKNLSVVGAALMKANNGTTASLSRLGLKTKTTAVDTLGLEKAHVALTQAQDGVTAATKKYGANSDQAKAAVLKLHEAQANLHGVQTKGKTTTLSLDDALKKMSDTYGGQAAAKAKSFDGTMQRLHATIHEGEVAVGDKLLPVLQRFADWIINKGIPGAEDLYHSLHENLAPVFDLIRDKLGFLVPVVKTIIEFMANNPQTVKTFAIALGILAGAIGVVTLATAAYNAVLDANPLTILIIALAAAAAGFQYAYTHSEKFRKVIQALGAAFSWLWTHAIKPVIGFIGDHWKLLVVLVAGIIFGPFAAALAFLITHFDLVRKAVHLLGAAGTWLWNNAFQPSIKFIVNGIALLIDVWGHMLSALGHLPGFGWAKKAGDAMQEAADKAHAFANEIQKIPDHKAVHVDLITTRTDGGVTHSSGGGHDAPNRPGSDPTTSPRTATGSPTDRPDPGVVVHVHGDVRPSNFRDFERQTIDLGRMSALGGPRPLRAVSGSVR